MPTELQPWTLQVLRLLDDGAWHVARDVIFDARGEVPPGRAFRTATNHKDPDTSEWSQARQTLTVSRGQKETVRYAVRSMVASGRLEQRGEGQAREIRLAPKP